MAFGKKNVVSQNLNDYSLILLGASGIGKTTTLYKVCEKEFGEDGYLLLNMGKEDGVSAIDGVVYEDVEDWKKFETVVNDIVKNKDAEYPNLKVVIFDTLDQLIATITEPMVIQQWNRNNLGKKDFSPAKTLNQTWGGFGAGQDVVIKDILDQIWKLKKVGVNVWMTGHVKTREIVDAISNQTYTTLSTDIMQKYFNAFKSKVAIVGVACIDRTIEKESTGRQNIVTKQDITVNKIKEERRKIVFRDDNYSVDSKSRFAGIVDEIKLDPDEFIKALKDAINLAASNPAPKSAALKKESVKEPEPELPDIDDEIDDYVDEKSEDDKKEIIKEIQVMFRNCQDKEKKKAIRTQVKEHGGFESCDYDLLEEIKQNLIKDE